ncbi:hypothetical protein B0H19DRAFT_1199590 [Mycena capillaripes]|nr:hypothetical protein B0H19DRAFT_1199590 [Mycena capillaripes]
MATCGAENGVFLGSARTAENISPWLLSLNDGPKGNYISPTGIVPSGAPMHDAYWAGLGGTGRRGPAGHRYTCGTRWRITGTDKLPWSDLWPLAPSWLSRTGPNRTDGAPFLQCGCFAGSIDDNREGRSDIRIVPHIADRDRHLHLASRDALLGVFHPSVYFDLVSTLDRRALTKCFRGVLNLRSVAFKLFGMSTCIWALKFPAAYGLAAPSVDTSDSTAPDSTVFWIKYIGQNAFRRRWIARIPETRC